jgi:hypothetical protein
VKIISSYWSRPPEAQPSGDQGQVTVTESNTENQPDNNLSRKERRKARQEARAQEKAKQTQREEARQEASTQEAPQKGTTGTYRRMLDRAAAKLAEKAHDPVMTPDARKGLMGMSRGMSLFLVAILDIGATGAAFLESFEALHQWALAHGMSGFWAFIFPFQVDTFIAIGEFALFIAIVDHWHWKNRVAPWFTVLGGVSASLYANVGHIRSSSGYPDINLVTTPEAKALVAEQAWAWDATAAIPPLASLFGMMIGFMVLKRVMNPSQKSLTIEPLSTAQQTNQVEGPQDEPEPEPEEDLTLSPEYHLERWSQPQEPSSNGNGNGHSNGHSTSEPQPATQAPTRSPGRRIRSGPNHPKWNEGVSLFKESMEKGCPLSQRELAAAMGMANRQLASKIIDHVNGNAGA